jgi:probable addiction module antidote protein
MIKKKVTKKREHMDFRDCALQQLQDPALALTYLNEALANEDQRVFLLALKNVLEAQGGDLTAIARESELSRPNLYRILSKRGNPTLTSLRSMLHAIGLDLAIQAHKNK